MFETMESIFNFVQQHSEWMYIAAFIAAMTEGTIFFAFLPGSIFVAVLGASAASGALSIKLLFVIVVIGAFFGDNIGYLLGRFFGRKIMKFKWIDQQYYVFAESFILKHGRKSIFFARFISGVKELAPFMAGVLDMNRKSFIIWNLAGGFVWAILWLGVGYLFGQDLSSSTNILKGIAFVGLIGFSSLLATYYLKNKEEFKTEKIIIDEILKKSNKENKDV